MPLIIKKPGNRLAFQFGRASALRTTCETVGQLIDQLRAERARNAEANLNIAQLRQELAAVRYELAKRDTIEAFRALPCGSTVH
jgi:molybdopterin converting factor small subunit